MILTRVPNHSYSLPQTEDHVLRSTPGLRFAIALAMVAAGGSFGWTTVRAAAVPPRVSPALLRQHDDSADVARAVEGFHQALERGDSSAALALLAADATILESGGSESVAEYRSHHLPADIEFTRAIRETRGPIRVTVRGDAAWTVSTSSARGEFKGRPVNSAGAELMVLTRSSGGWRIAAIHWSSRRRSP